MSRALPHPVARPMASQKNATNDHSFAPRRFRECCEPLPLNLIDIPMSLPKSLLKSLLKSLPTIDCNDLIGRLLARPKKKLPDLFFRSLNIMSLDLIGVADFFRHIEMNLVSVLVGRPHRVGDCSVRKQSIST